MGRLTWTRIEDAVEEVRVKWVLLDVQKKQIVLLASLYLIYTLLDVGGAVLKARIARAQ
jgi:hypothetical protein